jgi:hypothetical protein
MEKEGFSYALIAIVAIVAIVALVIGFSFRAQTTAVDSDLAGEAGYFTCVPKCPSGYFVANSTCFMVNKTCYGSVYCVRNSSYNWTWTWGQCVKTKVNPSQPLELVGQAGYYSAITAPPNAASGGGGTTGYATYTGVLNMIQNADVVYYSGASTSCKEVCESNGKKCIRADENNLTFVGIRCTDTPAPYVMRACWCAQAP